MADQALEGANAFKTMQEVGIRAQSERRKSAAYNALRSAYGDVAGDPEAAASLQATEQKREAFPDVRAQLRAKTSQENSSAALGDIRAKAAAQTQRNAALLNGALFVQSAIDRGGDAGQAFDQIAPHLGMDPEQAQQVRDSIAKDPASVKDFVAGLQKHVEATSRYQIVQGDNGQVYRVTADGVEPLSTADGKAILGAQAVQGQERLNQGDRRLMQQNALAQPEFKGAQAAAVAENKVKGTTKANLPSFEAVLTTARNRIEQVRKDPAIDAIFGSPTLKKMLTQGGFGAFGAIPGTPAADAAAKVTALVSELRSQAYETLKGGGQITEAESKFASESLANLERAQSKQSFMLELKNLESVLNRAEAAAKSKAGVSSESTNQPSADTSGGRVEGDKINLHYNPSTGLLE